MTSEPEYDLLIVGGGLAGMTAANRAADLGLRVAVFEKGGDADYPCNTRYSGGVLHVGQQSADTPPEKLRARIDSLTNGVAQPDLAQALASDFARAVTWLRTENVKLIRTSADAHAQAVTIAPPRPPRPGVTWAKGYGGDAVLTVLTANLKRRGGHLFLGAPVVRLIVDAGVCRGIVIADKGGEKSHYAPAVLLTDGGFQANPALIREHIGQAAERALQRNAGSGTGDGLRMAQAAGAAARGLEFGFYGHVMSLDALKIPALWPYPLIDRLAMHGIVVGPDGRRVMDEGRGAVYITNMLARLGDPQSAIAIFDQDIWAVEGRSTVIPIDPWLEKCGGKISRASTIGELAADLGVDAAQLEVTVREYNEAIAAGGLGQLNPSRSTPERVPVPIRKPPYCGIRLVPGITYTMGGIATDADGRVTKADGQCLAGLFAAGATTGGLDGGPNYGYVGGLSKAIVFGLRAAECIARDRTAALKH